MSLSEEPAFVELERALKELIFAAGAHGAAVLDQSDYLWCYACFARSDELVEEAKRFYATEVAPRRAALKRGTKLQLSLACDVDARVNGYWAQSFASIYVLVAFFKMPFDEAFVGALATRALPRIEALTLALPPPDGPHTTSGAQKQRA